MDEFYMQRSIDLAQTALGNTFPNPCVGCVIVDSNGTIVGEGYHKRAGQLHAEAEALKMAGVLANGSTAYVSLEPCNHFGRTPPCAQALIRLACLLHACGILFNFTYATAFFADME